MTKRNSFIESTKETDERLEALKQLYPEIFSDGKINLDAFKDVTGTSDLPEGQDRTPGYYGLYWPGKRAAKQLARKEAEGTLEPVPGDGVNEDTTHNIYIEGDNLEVLRILKQSYKGRVKMIYIDPPYNTGNDFIYPDDFKMPVEEYLKMTGQADEGGKRLVTNLKSNGAFHTNWLNMMYPRLQLARELLTEDGVIFISIDDNEQANLKLLCDDVFGEENFFASIIIRANSRGQTYKQIARTHEFMFIYTKSDLSELYELEKDLDTSDLNLKDEIGAFNIRELRNRNPKFGKFNRPGLFYPFYVNPNSIDSDGFCPISLEKKGEFKIEVLPYNSEGKESCWRWGKNKSLSNISNYTKKCNLVAKKKQSGEFGIYEKYRKTTYKPKSIWDDNSFLTETGTVEVKKLGFSEEFDFPKPIELIKRCLALSSTSGDIVMDFFSGSSTTAEAAMRLNLEDECNRKYIMVQLEQNIEKENVDKKKYPNICEVAKERIRRAGAKILEEAKSNKDMFSEDYQLDIGFKVYRLQNSNFVKYTPVEGQDEDSQNKLFEEFEKNQIPLVQGWKTENVLTEIILKQGFALDCTKENVDSFKKNKIWKITDSADAVSKKIKLYVCLDNFIEEETIKNLTLNDDEKFICLDAAIDDSAYARLADKGRIETI
ncbi:MAG: site-specific DNA-methyltransferase [Treponema sp.]|nr:site-specific DNA-methyltransferase [Treponema sp.]